MSLNFGHTQPPTTELAALERLKIDVVTTLALSFLIGSSSFLQVIKTTIKAWMSLNFAQPSLGTVELAALEHLE